MGFGNGFFRGRGRKGRLKNSPDGEVQSSVRENGLEELEWQAKENFTKTLGV